MPKSLTRFLLAFAMLLPLAASGDLSVKVAINFDGTVDTEYRDGDKPNTGGSGCPSGWTCAAIGDATTCDVEATDSDTWTITASGTNDLGNYCLAYKTAATDQDIHIEAEIGSPWTGHQENFTGCGVVLREGTAQNDYMAQTWWPSISPAGFKTGTPATSSPWAGTVTGQSGASGQSIPRYVALEYDDSETEITGWESDDDATWFQIGSAVTKSLTFPVTYGIFCTSHDPNLSTTFPIDQVEESSTLDLTDAGDPDPPSGNDFPISSGTTTFDCNAQGVQPGDTLTLQGTSRSSNLTVQNCVGTEASEIILRNDPTESSAFQTNVQNGNGLKLDNVIHFQVDGENYDWVGKSASAVCGSDMPNGSWDNKSNAGCGIRLVHASGSHGSGYIFITGSSREVEVRGVYVDGNGVGGAGIHLNDHNYLQADHPGEVRTGIVIENNVIHDNSGGGSGPGFYLGPNSDQGGVGDLDLGDVTVRGNWLRANAGKCIAVKSALQGQALIEWNWAEDCAFSRNTVGIGVKDSSDVIIRNNYVIDTNNRAGIRVIDGGELQNATGNWTLEVYNNQVIDSDEQGILVAFGAQSWAIVPTIYNNTIVDNGGDCIRTAAIAHNGGTVRDNICAGNGGGISLAEPGISNSGNIVGSVAAQNFTDSASNDFTLTAASQAVDSASTSAPSNDLLGTTRPQGAADDTGAFEYVP